MTLEDDKRRYLRLGAFLEGTFQTEDGTHGLIMLINFSREGLKACLNRKVPVGNVLKLEVWMPGSIIPVFAKGSAVWIKKGNLAWTYQYDAGIKIMNIEKEDRQRIIDYAYEHWRNTRGRT